MDERGPAIGLYAISVVAHLVGTGQQNIRLYERRGLLSPDRTAGGTRQYSEADLAVLRRIGGLLEEGLNLAGVAKVLELEAANARLRAELKRARSGARTAASGGARGNAVRAGDSDGAAGNTVSGAGTRGAGAGPGPGPATHR